MKFVEQYWSFERPVDGLEMLRAIERAGRTCYKSEDKITNDSAKAFCERIIRSGHYSVLEHVSISVRIVTNRGVSHELVRHRLASYSQESTRYCDYSGGDIQFIMPIWTGGDVMVGPFVDACANAEQSYKALIDLGWTPQQAREVLPNALRTELVMTCNVREWRHFFKLRCSKRAHPQMRDLALSMLYGFRYQIPVLFDGLE